MAMSSLSGTGRGAAALAALAAWVGLAVQLNASSILTGSMGAAAWVMLRYFTVITNLALAVIFTGVAFGRPAYGVPTLLGGVTLSILLVGVVYFLLLRGLVELSGGARAADVLLHQVTPILGSLFWLACVPKGLLRSRDPWLWAAFPLAYLVYALVRGGLDGAYAYPFIDVAQLGWAQTGFNAAAIALSFILAGHAIVWLDAWLAHRAGRVPS